MLKGLRARLIRRLAAVFAIVAPLLGGSVLWLELERVDEAIVDMSVFEADIFREAHPDLVTSDLAAHAGDMEVALDRFLASRQAARGGHFVLAEIYDVDQDQVAEAANDEGRDVEKSIDRSAHTFYENEIWYGKNVVNGRVYVQALIPLRSADGLEGWFEGVFRVSDEALVATTMRTALIVLAVILAVGLTTVALYPIIIALNGEVLRRSQRILEANIETLEVLGGAIAKRDSDTHLHNFRVTLYAILLAELVALPERTIRELIKGAFLHDVGKIAIPDAILLKPGRLTEDEFAVMRTHVDHGIDIVAQSSWLTEAADVVRYHHEKYDGSGYMTGLAGEDIPVTARIFAIVDVFDALTSRRPYKDAMPLDKATSILREGRGSHFDPDLLDRFLTLAPDMYQRYANREDEVAAVEMRRKAAAYFAAAGLED